MVILRCVLHAKPHVRPISWHVTSLSWQEPEELNKLLLMKVSGRNRNVKVNMLVVCEVSFIIIINQPKNIVNEVLMTV